MGLLLLRKAFVKPQFYLLLQAAKRHGHAEVKVEKKEVTFAFLVIVTSTFGVSGILLVSLLQFFHFSENFSRKNQNFKRF